jgi:ATP-binding cassette subfamily B (MDR/TAP) protein 6
LKNVLDGHFTVGDYIMFGTYIAQLYTPLNWLGTYYRMIQGAFIDTETLMDLLAEYPETRDPIEPIKLANEPLSFELDNVTFSYKSDERVILRELSFKLPAGETWALVGESGCGKSTISRLLTGLLEPDQGRVLVNGHGLREVGYKQIRSHIGIVSQDCPLFNASIRENISYAKMNANDAEVEEAARAAELKYEQFENGLDSLVGERGLALSGGEKQRVAIGRVLLKQPNAIILDEATSSLDSITESQISRALKKMAHGKTCVIIAHRLSTIVHADCILMISKGQIIESGTHRALLDQQGEYARLWNEQAAISAEMQQKEEQEVN